MKKLILLFFFLILTGPAIIIAQTDSIKVSIFDELVKQEPGKGTVKVTQESSIRQMVGKRIGNENIEKNKDNDQTFLKMQGFRVQVFSGNNQRKSKEEAIMKEKMMKEIYPDLPMYIDYIAPFWKLRAGDFSSREEAYSLMQELKEAFPSFAKEMYIVKDEVKIPL